MGTLLLLQVALDLGLIAIMTVILIERSRSRNSEDPRMSRGLQMLTSKIAIVQDLMDRSETTVKQLSQILEAKQQDVQEAVENVERHLHRVHESIEKSKNVARMFQDKIPHEEIIERQNAAKYIKAAKLAHQGLSINEIANQVDIPRGELELIIKINKQNLIAPENPAWLEEDTQITSAGESGEDAYIGESTEESTTQNTQEYTEEFQKIEIPKVTAEIPSLEKMMAEEALGMIPSAPPQRPLPQTLIYSNRSFQGRQMQETASVRPVVFKKVVTDPITKRII